MDLFLCLEDDLPRAIKITAMADKHIFIFGLGYVGRHLAASLYDQGWQIWHHQRP